MRDGTSPTGRIGVIVPTGIATDDTTKFFFADCVDDKRLVSLFDFENRAALFPGVSTAAMKFCLLTLSGRERPVDEAEFVFFAHRTADLADPERRFTLSPDDLALINPNTKTAPSSGPRVTPRSRAKIYRNVPVLVRDGDPDGNPWGIEFQQGLFNMTSDSHLFRTREELEPEVRLARQRLGQRRRDVAPLYEAKMAASFDHRAADVVASRHRSRSTRTARAAQSKPIIEDPTYVAQPRYWVGSSDVRERLDASGRDALAARVSGHHERDERANAWSLRPCP